MGVAAGGSVLGIPPPVEDPPQPNAPMTSSIAFQVRKGNLFTSTSTPRHAHERTDGPGNPGKGVVYRSSRYRSSPIEMR